MRMSHAQPVLAGQSAFETQTPASPLKTNATSTPSIMEPQRSVS